MVSARPIVSLEELDGLLARPGAEVRLVDTRWKLGDPEAGRRLFEEGHIPGASYVDMDRDLAAPPGRQGRHPLPSSEDFAAAMARSGVGDGTTVIAYDDENGLGAARLWWLLRHFGHEAVYVLDGGLRGWLAAGRPAERGQPAVRQHFFTARKVSDDSVEALELRELLARDQVHLLDARAPERWRGEIEPVDREPGRIPGSVNAPAAQNLLEHRFRSPEDLHSLYRQLGVLDGKAIVVSCGSGVTACVDLLGLELAGIHGAKLYPGSYSEWLARGFPIEKG